MSKHRQEKRKFGKKAADASDATARIERDQPVGRPQPTPEPAPEPTPQPTTQPAPRSAPVAVPRPRPTSAPKPRDSPPQQGRPAPSPAKSKPSPTAKPAARSAGSTPTTYATRPAATYGGNSPAAARALLLVGLAVSGLFLVWLAWAAWFHSTPSVTSQLVEWKLDSDHQVVATIDVDLDQGVRADCLVQALAEDHSVVGEVHFPPIDGTNTITIRTERLATAVESVGCTSPGQSQRR